MQTLYEKLETNDELNRKLFDGDKLKEDVRERAIEIAQFFAEESLVPIDILDVLLVGSNASYNYTEQSDFDLHIVTNFEFMDASEEILRAVFDSEKGRFRDAYEITIKGIPVEIYVQDIDSSVNSNGVYSIMEDGWIKYPEKIEIPKYQYFETDLRNQMDEITKILATNDAETIKNKLNQLYLMRKNSIAADGEFGEGNLIFKELRNLGYKDKLVNRLHELTGRDLTLESFV